MGHSTARPSGAEPETTASPNIRDMRAAAAKMVGEDTQLPRWETVQEFARLYRSSILRLIPAVEGLIAQQPADDVPAAVARACIAEARRRLNEIEANGLDGEVKRVQRLARSVIALCDHYENLGAAS